jgi:hypothetical protein
MPAVTEHRGGTFEVMHGVHDEGGVLYEAGEAVTSDKDLDRMFPEKFKRKAGQTRRPRDLDELPDESGPRVMDRPLHTRYGKKKSQEKVRTPAKKLASPSNADFDEEDVEEYEKKKTRKKNEWNHEIANPPDEDEEDTEDEDKETMEGLNEDEEDGEESPEDGEESPEDGEEVENEYGKDVSGKFPDAVRSDLKVFKGDRGYNVFDSDDVSKPLHETPFATKDSIGTFIEDYRSGDAARTKKAEKKKAKAMKDAKAAKAMKAPKSNKK